MQAPRSGLWVTLAIIAVVAFGAWVMNWWGEQYRDDVTPAPAPSVVVVTP